MSVDLRSRACAVLAEVMRRRQAAQAGSEEAAGTGSSASISSTSSSGGSHMQALREAHFQGRGGALAAAVAAALKARLSS